MLVCLHSLTSVKCFKFVQPDMKGLSLPSATHVMNQLSRNSVPVLVHLPLQGNLAMMFCS